MKQVIVFVIGVLVTAWVHAAVVIYQPTPYPLKKMVGTPMPQDLDKIHVMGGNVTSWEPSKKMIRESFLDTFRSAKGTYQPMIKFDLTGLPTTVSSVSLYLYPFKTSNPSPYIDAYKIDGAWNASTTWTSRPKATRLGWLPPPKADRWYGINITDDYKIWKISPSKNQGYLLDIPAAGYEAVFWSTLYSDYANDKFANLYRPALLFDMTPSFEMTMPLPGGYSWLVTNEIGGYECMGATPWPDSYHQDATGNYYALDIAPANRLSGGRLGPTQYTTDIPILAVKEGTVVEIGNTENHPNGYYIVIDHDHDGDKSTGFTTRYLHLKQPPARKDKTVLKVGDPIYQGDQIGIMGSTGRDANGNATSTGVHLHFGIRYNNSGLSTVPELSRVLMEGKLLKSYQTECNVDAKGRPTERIAYYDSSTIVTGE